MLGITFQLLSPWQEVNLNSAREPAELILSFNPQHLRRQGRIYKVSDQRYTLFTGQCYASPSVYLFLRVFSLLFSSEMGLLVIPT